MRQKGAAMNERGKIKDEVVLERYLGDPYLILAYNIFNRALLDCVDCSRHEELRIFYKSDWCSFLLMDAMTPKEIEHRFEREMKLAPEAHIEKFCGIWNKAVSVDKEKLMEARKSVKLTRKAVSERLGINANKIAYWELQSQMIPQKALEKLCALYDISVEEVKGSKNGSSN